MRMPAAAARSAHSQSMVAFALKPVELGHVLQAASLLDGFDYALWMDADNHLVADCCEDLLGTLVALRHGWSYSSGTPSAGSRIPMLLQIRHQTTRPSHLQEAIMLSEHAGAPSDAHMQLVLRGLRPALVFHGMRFPSTCVFSSVGACQGPPA